MSTVKKVFLVIFKQVCSLEVVIKNILFNCIENINLLHELEKVCNCFNFVGQCSNEISMESCLFTSQLTSDCDFFQICHFSNHLLNKGISWIRN